MYKLTIISPLDLRDINAETTLGRSVSLVTWEPTFVSYDANPFYKMKTGSSIKSSSVD